MNEKWSGSRQRRCFYYLIIIVIIMPAGADKISAIEFQYVKPS